MSGDIREVLEALERFGTEQNVAVQFHLTDTDMSECFRLELGEVECLLHARAVADLVHKGTLALLDWIALAAGEVQT